MLTQDFMNCLNLGHIEESLPTFRRGDSTISTIDYIFASNQFTNCIKNKEVSFLASSWTDHALLSTTFDLGPTKTGKGYWQGNPIILDYKDFRRELVMQLTQFFNCIDNNKTPQQQWETLKYKLKKIMQNYSWERINKTTQYLTKLQSKRNKFL